MSDETTQSAYQTVMDLYFALRELKQEPTMKDLVKLAKRLKATESTKSDSQLVEALHFALVACERELTFMLDVHPERNGGLYQKARDSARAALALSNKAAAPTRQAQHPTTPPIQGLEVYADQVAKEFSGDSLVKPELGDGEWTGPASDGRGTAAVSDTTQQVGCLPPGTVVAEPMRPQGCTCSYPAMPLAGHQGACPLRDRVREELIQVGLVSSSAHEGEKKDG